MASPPIRGESRYRTRRATRAAQCFGIMSISNTIHAAATAVRIAAISSLLVHIPLLGASARLRQNAFPANVLMPTLLQTCDSRLRQRHRARNRPLFAGDGHGPGASASPDLANDSPCANGNALASGGEPVVASGLVDGAGDPTDCEQAPNAIVMIRHEHVRMR